MRRPGARTAVALLITLAALVLVGCAPARHAPFPVGYTPDPNDYGQEPHGWAHIATGPLSARHGATAVIVHGRYLVIGGTGDGRALRDGAAYDPRTDQWARIAQAPVPIATADFALFGSALYLITPGTSGPHRRFFLRYDPQLDQWTHLASPPARPGHLLVKPGSLVDVADATAGTSPADFFFAPDGRWEPENLPVSPIGLSHNRRLFWADGDLVLFAQSGPASSHPSLVRTSTIRSNRGWSSPTTLPTLGTDPLLVTSNTFVFPDRGRLRGSDGKTHPAGAIQRGRAWTELPSTDLTPMTDAGITQTLLVGNSVLHDGLFLDLTTDRYKRPPAFIGAPRTSAASATGDNLFVWGGTDSRTGHDLADGYLLYP